MQIIIANTSLHFHMLFLSNQYNMELIAFAIASVVAIISLIYILYLRTQNRRKQHVLEKQYREMQKFTYEFELLSILANETDNLVIVTDKNGNLTFANKSFREIFGLSDIETNSDVNIFDLKGFDSIRDLFRESVTTRNNAQTELYVITKFQRRLWLQISISHAVFDDNHRVMLIATNINNLKFAEEEISQQSEELMVQSEQLEAMNTELEYVNQVTTDSINYAQRIQYAILPRREDYIKHIIDSFIMFRPRNIVSGDFYWYGEAAGKAYFVEADCTGHGVPGALMATIGNTLLNEIVISENVSNPAIILKELDRKVKSVLRQEAGLPEQQDGMDMTIAQYDYEKQELSISIANQFAFLYHEGELKALEGSLFAIGGSELHTRKPDFNLYRFMINPGDIFYMFSDGYRDQFNRDETEKMMYQRFKDIILEVLKLDMDKQKAILSQRFDEWKGSTRQIDDVLVWGIKF